jgi:integrase
MILAQLSNGLTGVNMLKLKVKDFQKGLIESIDEKGAKRRVCMLNLVRQKTDKKYTTFFSEEAVIAIEKYLERERIKPQGNEALFSSYKMGNKHMTTTALQTSYRHLNEYIGWEQEEKGRFRKATSHMMRKTFNTLLIMQECQKRLESILWGML